ncbi:DUF4383 domain-containing protein [Humibacillus xanthopallidus]|uniref:Uncharacterized protein DUF4383 n=1 Tax=Humibacillus xanthopallidus TaxID=412689 RepID=A0A543HHU7_9MICO|nr:DUF4383 domain-containing protein [Humibacillus xanthopallidus]TQM57884.1 uncharacterized protein DUF4383 [Humibacillus xanthopallidus]
MSTRSDRSTTRPSTMTSRRSSVQGACLFVGLVFLIVGIAGFIPGFTTQYSSLGMAGHESDAMLLGLFQVSMLHNAVHLLFGVVGILAARTWSASRAYLIGGGVVYLALWIYGLAIDKTSAVNVVPLNRADDWLHLLLGVGMLLLGLVLGRRRKPVAAGHDAEYGDWRRDSASS